MKTSVESMNEIVGNEEGANLLGSPTFAEIGNGRLRCVETGHELLVRDTESYSRSKRCRLGLIDHALSQGKPPLNMFTQHPISRSKLLCKLTGGTVNKSEEHIWKHMNGRRYLNKLGQKLPFDGTLLTVQREMGIGSNGRTKPIETKKKKKAEGKEVVQIVSEARDKSDGDSIDSDFWMPPDGDGSVSDSDLEQDSNEGIGKADSNADELEEMLERTKRMSIEMGPSSFASRKKKSRGDTS